MLKFRVPKFGVFAREYPDVFAEAKGLPPRRVVEFRIDLMEIVDIDETRRNRRQGIARRAAEIDEWRMDALRQIGRASCRERVCQYV